MRRSHTCLAVAIGFYTLQLLSSIGHAADHGDAAVIDRLNFDSAESETAHGVAANNAEHLKGLLDAPALRLLSPADSDWQGGSVSFTIKVDPQRQNYLTARLSGSDVSRSRMILYCEGKQIGYRHLGDIDILDFGSEDNGGGYPGRFFYVTSPLPIDMTRGKQMLHCEIRSTGPVYGYAGTFDKYQKPMTMPTHGLYAVYTHTAEYFEPPADEQQGVAPPVAVRSEPGEEVLDTIKKRCNDTLAGMLTSKNPLSQVQMHMLARAYHIEWTVAYHKPEAVRQLVRGLDALQVAFEADPKVAQDGPGVYNAGWFGLGLAGDALRLTAADMRGVLDQPPEGSTVTRRVGWSKMLQASRDFHRAHRRLYTNQTMINDLNVYRANRGVAAIDPAHAMPEAAIRRYLYESLGMQPWRDSDTDVPGFPAQRWNVGDHYMQLTAKGLTKELGYVGYYGEVIDWATQIYDDTREPGQEGDPKIKAQVEKIAAARAVFRFPAFDEQLNRAMRIETIIGWRDMHYPGDIVYGERPSWDATPLYSVAATLDDTSLGYANQMLSDNQFFDALKRSSGDASLRVTAGLLGAPDQYAAVKAHVGGPGLPKLPMTADQPDFIFSDEDDGVVAFKDGADIFYASLYWRARYAINFLARVHYMQPAFDHIATVREQTAFTPSGDTYKRPDWTNFGFGGGGPGYPGDLHSAHTGEELPIAAAPAGMKIRPGDENVYAGRGTLYTLRYGPYWIAMNCSDRPQSTAPPAELQWTDLATHLPSNASFSLPAKTTKVLKAR